MASKVKAYVKRTNKQVTSIGKSKNSRYNKKRHRKNGKKLYRGQGK